jgi:nitrogen regulatory protein PII
MNMKEIKTVIQPFMVSEVVDVLKKISHFPG